MSNKNLPESILSLKINQVHEYLMQTIGDVETDKFANCSLCGKDDWKLHSYPGEPTKPIIVAHPIPFSKNLACWFFPVTCKHCAHTIYFDAQIVATKLGLTEDSE
ncbi:hypothetical protein [Enterobacter cloacae complex sp. YD19/O97A5]|uniref:hypothetical protein n=1 Tax=Enterobacter cloacae complex TaxID=354276 RepID=UPI003B7B6A81